MAGPESALGVILFMLLGFGSDARDVLSYLDPDHYFKSRKVEVSVDTLLAMAARSPSDGTEQVRQLLAIRKLGAEGRKDERVRTLLKDIAEGKKGKDRLGFAEDYARAALARLDGKPAPTQAMPKDSMRSDAFAWFPKEAGLVGALDLRPVEGVPAADVAVLQELFGKYARETNADELYKIVEKVGNVRVDRFSVGLAPDPQQGGNNGRIYVRITGKADHKRLVAFIREMMREVDVREEAEKGKEAITFIQAREEPPVLAVLGDSELLIAGRMDFRGDHMAVMREMLDVRAGKWPGVPAGKLAGQLKKARPQTFLLVAGDVSKELGLGPFGVPGVNGRDFLPRNVFMEVARTGKGLDLLAGVTMEVEADAQQLADEANTGLKRAVEDMQRELQRKQEIPKQTVDLLTKTLESVKVGAKAADVTISVHVSNELLKVVPDTLGKLGAFPGPRPDLPPPLPPVPDKGPGDIKRGAGVAPAGGRRAQALIPALRHPALVANPLRWQPAAISIAA